MCLYFYRIYKDSTDNFIVKYVFVFLGDFLPVFTPFRRVYYREFFSVGGLVTSYSGEFRGFYFILPLAVLMEEINVMRSSRHKDSKRSYSAGTI